MLNIVSSFDQLLQAGLQHHQAGRLPEAEAIYRQVLAQEPQNAGALRLLGALAGQVGKHDVAVDLLSRALAVKADFPDALLDLGNAYHALGRLDEAISTYQRATQLNGSFAAAYNNLSNVLQAKGRSAESLEAAKKALALVPQFPEAHNNLGNALQSMGRIDEAVKAYEAAVALKPNFATACFNLGNARRAGRHPEAAATWYQKATEANPGFAEAHFNLGSTLQDMGRFEEAVASYRRAIATKPDLFEAHRQLGDLLQSRGRYAEAIEHHRRAWALKTDFPVILNELANAYKAMGMLPEAIETYKLYLEREPRAPIGYNNMAVAYMDSGRYEDAVATLRKAIEIEPNFSSAYANMGSALKDMGDLEGAIAAYRRALALSPGSAVIHSKLAYTLCFHPDHTARMLLEEARRWDARHARPLAGQIRPHGNERSPERRLKIGYVSPDFRTHCQSFFTTPLLSSHDHKNFEIHCYADLTRPDGYTTRLQGYADVWRNTTGLPDEQVAEMIRRDGIDILVDLTMHMADNRLGVFARKPAPVQVSWLAYPGTTGVSTIDYRITDPRLDPPGMDESVYSEKTVRLPDTFWCYDPLEESVGVSALPARSSGHITFGCLNNYCKLNPGILALWARVLHAVPDSRLLLLSPVGGHRQRTLETLAREGIPAERIEFTAFVPRVDYLRLYHRIDLGLDSFPYNGHTTSLDSFWMGVPVVTLVGEPIVSRAGLSQLHNLGLTDLAAKTGDAFVRIASELARDLPRLEGLRGTLRSRMQKSPLMDAGRFARNMEGAYRGMWRGWCG